MGLSSLQLVTDLWDATGASAKASEGNDRSK